MLESDEFSAEARLLAALAHVSIVVQGVGLVVGMFVYVNQREKSRFAAFQALQAVVYQLFVFIAGMVISAISTGIGLVSMSMMEANGSTPASPLLWLTISSMFIPLALMAIVVIYAFWGGYQVWQGQDFRYPLIGRWLENSELLS